MTIPIDPIGLDSYMGLAVPLHGESAIRQRNSSNAIVTLMHSSLNTGRFLMGMDCAFNSTGIHEFESSNLTNLAVFDIDATGHFRAVSGTTVKMKIGAAGLFAGGDSSLLIDPAKGYRVNTQRVTTVATATTGVAISSVDSGTLYLVTSDNSTCQFTLPATPAVGDFYDFFCNTTDGGDQTIMTAATGNAQGFIFYQSTGDFLSTAGITNVTSGPMYIRVVALTIGSLWAVQNLWQHYNSTTLLGQIAAASTST